MPFPLVRPLSSRRQRSVSDSVLGEDEADCSSIDVDEKRKRRVQQPELVHSSRGYDQLNNKFVPSAHS